MGLKLARKYNGEIVNADSRQIYREMDIGTGKTIISSRSLSFPRRRESTATLDITKPASICNKIYPTNWISASAGMTGKKALPNIPIHLINIKSPNQKFSLSQYKKLAIKTINNIHKRNKIPILAGGTGLYISAIVDNLEIPKAAPNKKIRERLEKHTDEYLFNKLKKIDLKSARTIGGNNKRKLIRALEVCEITGKPFSSQQIKGEPLFNILQIGIKIDREKLYKKIDERVDEMIRIGLIKEIKKLSKKYSFDLPAMSGIGYFEIGQYLKNKITLDDAVQKIKYRTHQYARRQMTWFKRDERIEWVENYKKAEKLAKKFLKH